MRSEDALRRLVDGADAVVHLAYEHTPGRYRGGEGDDLAAWMDANVMGSLRLLTLAAQAHVARFVFLSSRAVFSRTDRVACSTRRILCRRTRHYGAYKAAVEAFLNSFQCQHDMLTFAVRATGVYGVTRPVERSKWWDLMVRRTYRRRQRFPPRWHRSIWRRRFTRRVGAVAKTGRRPGRDGHGSSERPVCNQRRRRPYCKARRRSSRSNLARIAASSPANPLECRNLRRLGIQLGGVAALEDDHRATGTHQRRQYRATQLNSSQVNGRRRLDRGDR